MEKQFKGLVSVIIPTYNRSEFLRRAIKSVINQSYKNLEIIVVVDNSTDNTIEILEEFKSYKRLRYIILKKNVGGAQARNLGMNEAKGEFFAFLDDDDKWEYNKISSQVSFLRKNIDIGIVSCQYYSTRHNKKFYNYRKNKRVTLTDLLYENILGSFSFCMLRKKHIDNLRINPVLKACQDWDLWLKILMSSKLDGAVIDEFLVNYTINSNGLTQNWIESYNSYLVFIKSYWNFMTSNQKFYHLYKKYSRQNYILKFNIFFKFSLAFKSIYYHFLSGYNLKLLSFLLPFYHIIPFHKIISKKLRYLTDNLKILTIL